MMHDRGRFGAASPSPRGVIALHCSGSSGRQWRPLAEALGGRFSFLAPDLADHHAAGRGDLTLSREAQPIVALLDARSAPAHLVGHSYGGAVALRAALERPDRVASLTLYEPTVFHLLGLLGAAGVSALFEIQSIAYALEQLVAGGHHRAAARLFFDIWNGEGSFDALRAEKQASLIRYAPKGPIEFRALFGERVAPGDYGALQVPTLILKGQHAPPTTALVASALADAMAEAASATMPGLGHMGPLTHADIVAPEIANHIVRVESTFARLGRDAA
jgi:pimeloyl-ACP methyl ester carboxylesterase